MSNTVSIFDSARYCLMPAVDRKLNQVKHTRYSLYNLNTLYILFQLGTVLIKV